MKEIKKEKNDIQRTGTPAVSGLSLRKGGTTYLISIYSSKTVKDTVEDKIKGIIRKEVLEGNYEI